MAKAENLVTQITCLPGVRRDGTTIDTNYWSDAQWVRFYRTRPKKIGGMYRGQVNQAGVTRAVLVSYNPTLNQSYVHSFNTSGIQRMSIDNSGDIASGGIITRTPSAGFSSDNNWLWQYDTMYDPSGGGATVLVAHANKPNTVDDETAYPVWYGKLNTTTVGEYPLATTGQSVSGGCVVLHPFLFIYGSNGLIQNSVAGAPATWTGGESNTANVAGSKIIKGLPIRGSGQSPAGLFWSRESLIRVTYVGGSALWRYDTLTTNTSVISSNCAIEYDGLYFWIGVDRFYVYDGSVKELPNQLNLVWFFENLNWSYRHRIWAMKISKWGEIWWFFPKTGSTECNHAIIFNLREKTWYDCELTRSAGNWAPTYQYPVMADPYDSPLASGSYGLWVHEYGVDQVDQGATTAIESYFETADFGYPTGGPGEQLQGPNNQTRLIRVEPDFAQEGDMTVQVLGSNYANGTQVPSSEYTFSSSDTKVDMREQRRLIRVKFKSNTVGGDFIMGKPLLHYEKGDVRG